MKRILYISNVSLANQNRGTPLRIVKLLTALKKKHSILVCVNDVPEEFADCFIPYPKGTTLERIRALVTICKTYKPDWIFTPTETGITPPVILKLLCGVRIAIDLDSVFLDEAYAKKHISWIHYWILRFKSLFLLLFYDRVFTISKKHATYYAPVSHSSRWSVAYCAIDVEELASFKSPMPPTNAFIIGYMGNTRSYQGLAYIFDAAKRLREEHVPVRLNLIISGGRDEAERMLRERGLFEVADIHVNVSHQEANKLIRNSHVLPIPRPSTPITEYAFPSKLPESMMTGIPIIVSDVGPVPELREKLQTCLLIIGHEHITEELTEALMRVYKMSVSERQALGDKERLLAAELFSWSALEKMIVGSFES